LAGWATVLNFVFGVAAGLGLSRWRSGARDVVDSLLTLPLVMPPTVLGYYLLVLLGRRGVLGAWLDRLGIQLVFTWQGAVIASMVVAFPLVLKSARAGFESVDPQLERAARTLGVGETAIFFRVTLPLRCAARAIIRRSCRAARNSASRWSRSRGCCCSTNRSRRSTVRCASGCAASYRNCRRDSTCQRCS
jgi:ABC-type molybdate transport system permease subunit